MFNFFKQKEKRQKSLIKNLRELTEEYEEYFNCYSFTGKNIIIYKKFEIVNNELVLVFIDKDTPRGYVSNKPFWVLQMQYDENFIKKHRLNFVRLKEQLEKFGLSVNKINGDNSVIG